MSLLDYPLGDGTVGELAFGLSLILSFVFFINLLLRLAEKRRTKPQGVWPALFQVLCADRRTVERWRKQLPAPSTEEEHKVINEIAHRHLFYNGLASRDSIRPTIESMTCNCGTAHPFVHVFGKCGKCIEKND